MAKVTIQNKGFVTLEKVKKHGSCLMMISHKTLKTKQHVKPLLRWICLQQT
jgi:hypothetical protein